MAGSAISCPSIRPIALPNEHGGWSFLYEPILLALLVTPSLAGFAIALATVGVFLLRHPLKLTIRDYRRERRYARTRMAERFVLLYGIVAAIAFGGAVAIAGPTILIPLILAAPFAALMLIADARNASRSLVAEIAGPIALASSAAMIAAAAGQSLFAAWLLWMLAVSRIVPTIVYVRAKLRQIKQQPYSASAAIAMQVLAIAVIIVFNATTQLTVIALVPFVILLGRTIWFLIIQPKPMVPQTLGVQEIIFGLIAVVFCAISYLPLT